MRPALLHERVAAQAKDRPRARAVVMNGRSLDFRELDVASNKLARAITAAGCRPGDLVAIAAPKSPAAIVAMIGTLRAGCAYVPLDVASPAARVARIVAASEPTLVLAAAPAEPLVAEVRAAGCRFAVGSLDRSPAPGALFGPDDVARLSDAAAPIARDPRDPAHVLFTSGSTGQPKGVVITHANVTAFLDWAEGYFGIGPGDRASGHSPLHFDLSTFDVFGTLGAGAELHLVPPELSLAPAELAAFIRESRLTQWFSVPSALSYLTRFDVVAQGDFPAMRRLMWCGDVLPTPVLRHLMRRLPHVSFTNLYGPTEATIASSFYTVPTCPADDRAPVPIGRPCAGEQLFVLGDDHAPVPPGRTGHLYIGGAGLSPGYLRDEARTNEVFVRGEDVGASRRIYRTGDLARIGDDGEIYFVGRADSQIKSRGYRIELGEIEAAASVLPELAECAVVAVEGGGFEGSLVCLAYATAPGRDVPPARVREGLARSLPGYMLPARWLRLDALPKNANGKIDRPRLRDRFVRMGEAAPPDAHAAGRERPSPSERR